MVNSQTPLHTRRLIPTVGRSSWLLLHAEPACLSPVYCATLDLQVLSLRSSDLAGHPTTSTTPRHADATCYNGQLPADHWDGVWGRHRGGLSEVAASRQRTHGRSRRGQWPNASLPHHCPPARRTAPASPCEHRAPAAHGCTARGFPSPPLLRPPSLLFPSLPHSWASA